MSRDTYKGGSKMRHQACQLSYQGTHRRFDTATWKVIGLTPCSRRKAAAEGALLWYAKQSVVARVAKRTFGIEGCVRYDPGRPSHIAVAHEFRIDKLGVAKRRGWWELCVKKVGIPTYTLNLVLTHPCRARSFPNNVQEFCRGIGSLLVNRPQNN